MGDVQRYVSNSGVEAPKSGKGMCQGANEIYYQHWMGKSREGTKLGFLNFRFLGFVQNTVYYNKASPSFSVHYNSIKSPKKNLIRF